MLSNINDKNDLQKYILPDRPHSAQLHISSGFPVFLFSLESPRQKSQYTEGLILPSGPTLGPCSASLGKGKGWAEASVGGGGAVAGFGPAFFRPGVPPEGLEF